MQSEYATKYNTKSDAINLNGPLLQVANLLADKTLPVERKSKVVLSKMQNLVNKAIVYPLTILASYLSGHGDYWFPLKTQKHDGKLFQRALRSASTAYDNDDVNCTIAPGRPRIPGDVDQADSTPDQSDEEMDRPDPMDHMDVDEDGTHDRVNTSALHAWDAVTMYESRASALRSWSPFEMTMAFECVQAKTLDAQLFKLDHAHLPVSNYGHKPFRNKSGKPSIRVPQLYSDPPIRPDDSAPSSEREDYAAFVLGNFTPYDELFPPLPGRCLWKAMQDWEKAPPKMTQENVDAPTTEATEAAKLDAIDRAERHAFALMCISHFQTRAEARLAMRAETKRINVQRRLVVAASALNSTSDESDLVSCGPDGMICDAM